jgi:hypothetical protein
VRPPEPALQQEGQEEGATGAQTATSSSSSPSTAATPQRHPWQTDLPAAPRRLHHTRPTQQRWAQRTQLLQQQPQLQLADSLTAAGVVVGRLCLALCLPLALLLLLLMSTGVVLCLEGVTLWQQYPLLAAGGVRQCMVQAQVDQMAPFQLV